MQPQTPKNTFGGVSTSNLGPVVFLHALENSKGETCFLLWCYKGSFFLWRGLDMRPLACQLTTIKHMLLIICEEHWSFLWPLAGSENSSHRTERRSWFSASVRSCPTVLSPTPVMDCSVMGCFPLFVP